MVTFHKNMHFEAGMRLKWQDDVERVVVLAFHLRLALGPLFGGGADQSWWEQAPFLRYGSVIIALAGKLQLLTE
jgi:hypothetical protein